MRIWWRSAALAISPGMLALGCGAPPVTEREAAQASPIVGGTLSDTADDAVVLLYDTKAGFECTGTVLAPTLVLTARHCVSDVLGNAVQCDQSGHAVSGGQLGSDLPASDLSVFVGTGRGSDFPRASAKGMAIFHDDAVNLCDHDLAVLQVDAPLAAPVAKLRLGGSAVEGEQFTVIGWGATRQVEITPVRERRSGVGALAIGPASYGGLAVPPNDFLLGESLCNGDSGGPAFSAFSGALVGVASFGGNGTAPVAGNPSSTCVDLGGGVANTFTALAPFKNVIDAAFAAAGAVAQIDDHAPPPRAAETGGCAVRASARQEESAPSVLAMIAALGAVVTRRRRG